MTVTKVGQFSVGGTLTATASATAALEALASVTASASAAITALIGIAGPEVAAKLEGYLLLQIPSPTFDFGAQVALTVDALASAMAELSLIPGGPALVAELTAGIAAQAAAQLAIRGANLDISAKIDAALAGKASLDVQASAGVSGPNVNLVLIAKVIAQLTAALALIEAHATLAAQALAEAEAKLALAAGIAANLDATGLIGYRFDGDLTLAGVELQAQIAADLQGSAELSGIAANAHFIVMLPVNVPAWTALKATVRTT